MHSHEGHTRRILETFEQISQVPRASKKERKIAAWLLQWAADHGFDARSDAALNIVIEVPASPGYEDAETLVLQGHMDMVCEKTRESGHDFDTDPIKLVYTDDGWLTAEQTTLGADNGIALAMALVAAGDDALEHPRLELLFTTDEETGLTGANALEPGFINGKQLLNIDSEDEGVFTIGCSGGEDARLALPFTADEKLAGYRAGRLTASGMCGGHSGIDIVFERANAIKLLFACIHSICQQTDARISSVKGGTSRNAIPREAEAVLLLPARDFDAMRAHVAEFESKRRAEYASTDPGLSLTLEAEPGAHEAASAATTRRAIDTLLVFPHGVDAMSKDIEGLVETSNNLARISTEEGKLVVLSNQRSSNMDSLAALGERILSVARLAGAEGRLNGSYAAWQPNVDSALLARCVDVYTKRFGKKPAVEAIHAGLECGIIGAKYPGMDMISFGPTIKNPHSPDEKINIESIGKVWAFMTALFESYR